MLVHDKPLRDELLTMLAAAGVEARLLAAQEFGRAVSALAGAHGDEVMDLIAIPVEHLVLTVASGFGLLDRH